MIAVATGFGIFSWYVIMEWNGLFSMIIGMHATALMAVILHKPTTRGKK